MFAGIIFIIAVPFFEMNSGDGGMFTTATQYREKVQARKEQEQNEKDMWFMD